MVSKLLLFTVIYGLIFIICLADRSMTAICTSSCRADLYLGGLFPVHANEDNRCGRILDLGVQRLEAMIFAINKINNDSSLLPGVRLGYVIRDTCIQENRALEESLNYLSATIPGTSKNLTGICGLVGAAASSVSVAVANLLRLFHIPQVSYASTAKYLSDKTRFDYFLRTIPPDLFQAQVMAELIVKYNWTYVVAISSGDTYGREGVRALLEALQAASVNSTSRCVAAQIEISRIAAEEEYDRAVETIEEPWTRNSSVIVIFGQLATAEGIMRAVIRRKKIDEAFARRSLTFIGSDAWGDQLPALYREVAHGMLSVIPLSRESKDFNKYMESKVPFGNTNPWFPEYWEHFFNCSLSNEQNRNPCNVNMQKLSIATGFSQNSKVPFAIDAVYAFAHAMHNLLMDTCGGVKLCSEAFSKPESFILKGPLLLQYLRNVSFSGESGVIMFDKNGDQHGNYYIKNLQYTTVPDQVNGIEELRFVIIGTWNMATERLKISKEVQWNSAELPSSLCSQPCSRGFFPAPVDGQLSCCWVCKRCPRPREVSDGLQCYPCDEGFSPDPNMTTCLENPQQYLHWSHPFTVAILLLNMAGLGATTTVAVTFFIYRNNKIVKASSRELSAFLLSGIFLCYLLPFSGVGIPTAYTCALHRLGFGICFSLCYAALLVKTNRIHRIFNRAADSIQQPPLISPKSQLFFTALLVLVQVVISAVHLVLERPAVAYVYEDEVTQVTCAATPYISLITSLGYNILLLIASAYYAFRTRKIPQNFNEAKFINLTLYSIFVVWLAFIPTYFGTAKLGNVFRMGSQVFAIIMSATATLGCLFFPKLYFMASAYHKEGKLVCNCTSCVRTCMYAFFYYITLWSVSFRCGRE